MQQPYYNQAVLEQLIKQYNHSPQYFNDVVLEQMISDANSYGMDFQRKPEEADFDLINTVKQVGAGFLEGFTTVKLGVEPQNAPERIARNLSHLAGFVGYVPKAPFTALSKTSVLAKAAGAIRGKSVPMVVAEGAMKIAKPLTDELMTKGMNSRFKAMQTASSFLNKTIPSDMVEGAFHLGTASAVSSWQGGVDEMMMGMVGGAQAGAAFRLIGNMVRAAKIVPGATDPKLGAKFTDMTVEQQQERMIQGLAASLFMGLPSTMHGATTPEQIYEYVLGAYFGVKEMPAGLRRRDRFLVKMFKDRKNPTKVPELTEGFDKLEPLTQKAVKEESARIWSEEGKILSKIAAQMMGLGVKVPPETAKERAPQEAPLPTSDIQTKILRATSKGVEPTKEDWKKFSEEEKIYYSDTIDSSPLEGWYSKRALNEFSKIELESIAERLQIPNYKNMEEEVLKANIVFFQPKSKVDITERLRLNLEEDDVFVESVDVSEYTTNSKLPGNRLVKWIKTNMKDEFKNLTEEQIDSKVVDIAGFIGEQAHKLVSEQGVDSRLVINHQQLADAISQKFGRKLNPDAVANLRQVITRANFADQVPHMTVRYKNTEEGGTTPVVEFLATKGHPVTATGESKLQREPAKIFQDLFTQMTGVVEENVYSVLDHVIEPGSRYYDTYSLFRYKEKLDNDQNTMFTYGKFMKNIMDFMHKHRDMYYMGGAGDKEKAFFFKYHPHMDTPKQLRHILNVLGDPQGNLYIKGLKHYIEKYTGEDVSAFSRGELAVPRFKEIVEMFDKAFVSNYLWEMSKNGFRTEEGYTDKDGKYNNGFLENAGLQAKHSQIKDAKGYNKRAQIDMNSGYRGDPEYIKNSGLVEDFNPETGYRYMLIPDAKKGFRLDTDRARKYIEHMDGGAIVRDDVIYAENFDSGMPEAFRQGQSKSFILSPHAEHGALMGKYMFHSAGPELSAAMKKKNIHIIFPESAVKQHGSREFNDYKFNRKNQTLKLTNDKIYDLPVEHIYRVFSEKQDRHYIDPQLFPSQGLSNLTTGVLDGKITDKEITDMVDGLIIESFNGTTIASDAVKRLFANPKSLEAEKEFFRNIEDVGVNDLLDILQTRGMETIQGKIYNHLMRVNDRVIEELITTGEIDYQNAENANRVSKDFENLVDRLKIISEELSTEYKKAKIDYPVLVTHMHKFTEPYRNTVVKNYIVHKATRPKLKNSISARMRPYDKGLQQTINNGKGFEENKFYLDDNFKELKIYTDIIDTKGRGYVSLEELWAIRRSYPEETSQIFRSLGIRVPMDSMSGGRAMEFGGFTGRKGYGVLLHPRVMRALGGADLDGDKAMIFFGGRKEDGTGEGLKQSWINLYERNKAEFTRYISKDKKKRISKEAYNKLSDRQKKGFDAYTMDNKNEPIPYGPNKGKTPSSLLALKKDSPELTKKDKDAIELFESKVGKYAPSARAQMSEAASQGRMLLGSAVIAKKVIQGAHSSVMAMPNQTNHSIETIWIPGQGQVSVEVFLKANNDPRNTIVHRMMAQTGVALGSDPMDEFGLRHKDHFFFNMFDPIFKVKIGRIWNAEGDYVGKQESVDFAQKYIYNNYKGSLDKLKKGGIIREFYGVNNALFGRNWLEGRKHTYGEIKRKIGTLARYPENTANSVLPKVAKLIHKANWNDNILSRLDPKGVKKVYDDYLGSLEKYSFLLDLMGRKTFAVTPDSRLFTTLRTELWTDKSQNKYIWNNKAFEKDLAPLFKNKKFQFLTDEGLAEFRFSDLAKETNEIKDVIQKSEKMTIKEYKAKLLEELVAMESNMIIQDLSDMVTTIKIGKLASGMPEDVVRNTIKRANSIKGKYMHLGKANKRTEIIKEEEVDGLDIITRGDRPSSDLTMQEMNAEINTYKSNMQGSKEEVRAQRELFDMFFLGSLHRGDAEAMKADLARLEKEGNLTPEIEEQVRQKGETAKTSLLRLGYGSRAIGNESIKSYIREMNILFNKSLGIPTPAEQANMVKRGTDTTPKEVEKVKVDLYEDIESKDPFQGIRGLSELDKGFESLTLDGKIELSKLKENLNYYHNSVGKNLQEIVRFWAEKDLDAMNLEDWKMVNRVMKDMRTETNWDKMVHWLKGTEFVRNNPEIKKRYTWLFPEAINRQLMLHDFDVLKTKGVFYDRFGKLVGGEVAQPTHQADKLSRIWGKVTDANMAKADEEINLWRRDVSNILESIEEGVPLWRVMVRKRELIIANHIQNKILPHITDKEERIRIGMQIKNYRDVHAKELIDSNWNVLKDKEFQFTYKDINSDKTISKRMTGQEALVHLDKVMTKQAEKMHTWLVGTKEYNTRFFLKDKKGKVLYHGDGEASKGNERMDLDGFIRWVSKKIKNGEPIPMELGQDALRKLSREVMYRLADTPELRKKISSWAIFDTKSFPFEGYYPHISYVKSDVDVALKKAIDKITLIPEDRMTQARKEMEIQKIKMRHKHLTGDWMFRDVEDWENFDAANNALKKIGANTAKGMETVKYFDWNQRTGPMFSRSAHLPGWDPAPKVIDTYIRNQASTFHRQLGQIMSRISLENFKKKYEKKWGEDLTNAWYDWFTLYIQNASGYPAKIPEYMLDNPMMNLKGTPYAWWADNKVQKKLNRIMDKLGMTDKSLPKELQGLSLQDIKNLSNLEAKYEMAALLAHPKSMAANIYGGTSLTIASAGLNNWKNGRNIKWLKANLNPGKDKFGNEWNGMQDLEKFTTGLGIIPELVMYEAGLNPNMKTANFRKFVSAFTSKLTKDPSFSDKSLRQLASDHGISDAIFEKASFFMRFSERKLRSQSFMAHLVQAWENFGGQLPYDHPILIEHARKGVKATQFLYNAPFRPMFAQTALGKVMTRFQLWSWNSVRFRNDVLREASHYGFRPGTEEFERFKRTAQIDLFMLALSSVFAYSLFEAALPSPWNWFQDTADWIFGDEKTRDRAFFGSWPTAVAPLQMVTPPILRMAPPTFRAFVDGDFTKLTDYYIWTMFPFGRMARDVAGPQNIIENPIRSIEKVTGLPYLQFHKEMSENFEEETIKPGGFRW